MVYCPCIEHKEKGKCSDPCPTCSYSCCPKKL